MQTKNIEKLKLRLQKAKEKYRLVKAVHEKHINQLDDSLDNIKTKKKLSEKLCQIDK